MRITESRLRRIIRSVILESNSALEYGKKPEDYKYILNSGQLEGEQYILDHNEIIDLLTGFDIPEDLLKDLDSNPSFLNRVMKTGKFESKETTFVDAYEAELDGIWDAVPDSWVDDFVEIARDEQARGEDLSNSKEDVINYYKNNPEKWPNDRYAFQHMSEGGIIKFREGYPGWTDEMFLEVKKEIDDFFNY